MIDRETDFKNSITANLRSIKNQIENSKKSHSQSIKVVAVSKKMEIWKIKAAIEAGMNKIIIPASNKEDIALTDNKNKKIEIIPVENVKEVIKYAFSGKEKEKILNKFK